MIAGRASQFHIDRVQGTQLTLVQLTNVICERLQTQERTRPVLWKCKCILIKSTPMFPPQNRAKSVPKSWSPKFWTFRASLPSEYRANSMIRDGLLNDVKDVDHCCMAYLKPAHTVQAVILDIYSALYTIGKRGALKIAPTVHYKDLRYHTNDKSPRIIQTKSLFLWGEKVPAQGSLCSKERLQAQLYNQRIRHFVGN